MSGIYNNFNCFSDSPEFSQLLSEISDTKKNLFAEFIQKLPETYRENKQLNHKLVAWFRENQNDVMDFLNKIRNIFNQKLHLVNSEDLRSTLASSESPKDFFNNFERYGIQKENNKFIIAHYLISKEPHIVAENFDKLKIQSEDLRIKLAYSLGNENPEDLIKNFEKFNIHDENTRIDFLKFFIKNLKLESIQEFLQMHFSQEMAAPYLFEFVKRIAKEDPLRFEAEMLSHFNIQGDQKQEIIRILAEKFPMKLIDNLVELNIQGDDKKLEIIKIIMELDPAIIAIKFKNFDIQCALQRFNVAMILTEKAPSELACNLKYFDIQDEDQLLALATILIEKDPEGLISNFKKFNIHQESKRLEFIEKLIKKSPIKVASYFDQFNIQNKEKKFEFAKAFAEKAPYAFSSNFTAFEIQDEDQTLDLIEILIKGKRPWCVAENFKIFNIQNEAKRFDFAWILAEKIPIELVGKINAFKIHDESRRQELAKKLAEIIPDYLAGTFDRFKISDENKKLEIIKIFADRNLHETIVVFIKKAALSEEKVATAYPALSLILLDFALKSGQKEKGEQLLAVVESQANYLEFLRDIVTESKYSTILAYLIGEKRQNIENAIANLNINLNTSPQDLRLNLLPLMNASMIHQTILSTSLKEREQWLLESVEYEGIKTPIASILQIFHQINILDETEEKLEEMRPSFKELLDKIPLKALAVLAHDPFCAPVLLDYIFAMEEYHCAVTIPFLTDPILLAFLKKFPLDKQRVYLAYATEGQISHYLSEPEKMLNITDVQQWSSKKQDLEEEMCRLNMAVTPKQCQALQSRYQTFQGDWKKFLTKTKPHLVQHQMHLEMLKKTLLRTSLSDGAQTKINGCFKDLLQAISKMNLEMEKINKIVTIDLKQKLENAEVEIPEELLCKLTGDLIMFPVIAKGLPPSELAVIKKYIKLEGANPFNRQTLSEEQLKPDLELFDECQKFKKDHPELSLKPLELDDFKKECPELFLNLNL